MKKILLVIIGLIMGIAAADAQAPAPINWRITLKMTSATEGVVNMRVIINDGWHLYGTTMPVGGPKATSFSFDGSQGVKFVGTPAPSVKPLEMHDAMFDADVTYWEGRVTFTQKFKITDPAKAVVKGSVSFMGCNDETCSPPKTQQFVLKIPSKK